MTGNIADPEVRRIIDGEVDGLKRKIHDLIGDKKKLQAKIRCIEDRQRQAYEILDREHAAWKILGRGIT